MSVRTLNLAADEQFSILLQVPPQKMMRKERVILRMRAVVPTQAAQTEIRFQNVK
jgi:hypothetical protein